MLDKPGKQELVVDLKNEREEVEVLGKIIATQEGEYEVWLGVSHKVENTSGKIKIRAIAKNGARVKIVGLVKILPKTNGTDDYLEIKGMILDEKSQITVEPKMEIESDEVRASHAAAVGKIDEEELFYLMSRGVDRTEAENLIVKGFLNEVEF